MTTEERLDRLTGIVDALASSVVAHDNQIESLIKVGEAHQARLDELGQEIRALAELVRQTTREWQAYLRRLPPQ